MPTLKKKKLNQPNFTLQETKERQIKPEVNRRKQKDQSRNRQNREKTHNRKIKKLTNFQVE